MTMREILFRGKRLSDGEWVTGYYIQPTYHWHKRGIHKDWIACGAVSNGGWLNLLQKYAVIHETVCQFTGLTDKNGKKIFEGDIVRVCLDPEICIGDVVWDSEIASYNIPFNNGKCVLPLDIFIAKNKVGDKVWIEVIGYITPLLPVLNGKTLWCFDQDLTEAKYTCGYGDPKVDEPVWKRFHEAVRQEQTKRRLPLYRSWRDGDGK